MLKTRLLISERTDEWTEPKFCDFMSVHMYVALWNKKRLVFCEDSLSSICDLE